MEIEDFESLGEVGVCAYNCTEDEFFRWAYGVFLHDIRELSKKRVDDN